MTVRTYKLTGRLPIQDVDGSTKWTGTVRLDDEVTIIDALVMGGGIEPAEAPAEPVAEPKGKTAPKE